MTLLVWTFDIDKATEIHALTKFIQKNNSPSDMEAASTAICLRIYILSYGCQAGAHDWLLELFGVRVGGTG